MVAVDLLVGGSWDAEYHRTQPFDGFFSPPHLFIYTLAAVAMALVAVLDVRPRLRDCFGPYVTLPWPVPVLGQRHPGSLILLTGGMAGIALAGPADAAWHTSFGLDETNWSFPHAMLGCSLALISVGFWSCRHALTGVRPMWSATRYLLGYLTVLACAVVMGPLQNYPTREFAVAAGSFGALASNPDHQHLVRIVTQANLTHTSPAYVLVAAAWSGLALGLLRAVDPRARYWLVVAVLVGLSLSGTAGAEAQRYGLAADPRVTAGLPLLTAALVLAVPRPRTVWIRYLVAGAAFGLHAFLVWGTAVTPIGYALAACCAPVLVLTGAAAGAWLYGVLTRPARRASLWLTAIVVLLVPAVTGTVDLVLRTMIP
ncbi:hypothetical protein [Micromonospora psammae]|uniref:hypothetical protein n=1 Tax=Micromonospora sp. CPCC 205556 TaxID=3122398 RepID=UPI002FEEF024